MEPVSGVEASAKPATPKVHPSAKIRAHKWTRLVHVYTSMIAFFVVLFFAVTGITLNHPEWTFGISPKKSAAKGILPPSAIKGTTVDWLVVSEYLRREEGVRGSVADTRADVLEGEITFKGPAYEADAVFKIDTRTYDLTSTSQGFVGLMNDLHKGRDTTSSWNWLIDVSGAFLTLVAVTGLALQFFLRKRRTSALTTAVTGTALAAILIVIASR